MRGSGQLLPLAFNDPSRIKPLVSFATFANRRNRARAGLGLGFGGWRQAKAEGTVLLLCCACCVSRLAGGAPRQLRGEPANRLRHNDARPPRTPCMLVPHPECDTGHAPPERSGRWQSLGPTDETVQLHMKSRPQFGFSCIASPTAKPIARTPTQLLLSVDSFRQQVALQKVSHKGSFELCARRMVHQALSDPLEPAAAGDTAASPFFMRRTIGGIRSAVSAAPSAPLASQICFIMSKTHSLRLSGHMKRSAQGLCGAQRVLRQQN